MGLTVTVTFEGGELDGQRLTRSLSKLTGIIANPVLVAPHQFALDRYRRTRTNNRGDVVYVLFEGPSFKPMEFDMIPFETPPPAGEPTEDDKDRQTAETTGDPALPSGGTLPAEDEPTEGGPTP